MCYSYLSYCPCASNSGTQPACLLLPALGPECSFQVARLRLSARHKLLASGCPPSALSARLKLLAPDSVFTTSCLPLIARPRPRVLVSSYPPPTQCSPQAACLWLLSSNSSPASLLPKNHLLILQGLVSESLKTIYEKI